MTNSQNDSIYHLTNIDDCGDMLRSGCIRPLVRSGVICMNGDDGLPHASQFVHFNFCPRSLMLFKLTQGHCWSAHRIWGQEDAVHIEIDYFQMMVHLSLACVANFIVSDSDSTHGSLNPQIKVFDVNSTPMSCIESMLDVSAIMRRINFFNADKDPGKGAEIMVGAAIGLLPNMVKTIGVHDGNAKDRLLKKPCIPETYKKKISIRDNWYF